MVKADEKEEQLKISVEDSGTGIAPEAIPYIFDRFYQVADATTKIKGSGIGLALTKELVELLGGKITVTSELDKGSRFQVLLPITRNAPLITMNSAADSGSDPAQQNHANPGQRLLIIEDNLDLVEYLKDCLDNRFQLEFAYNGTIGIEKALELVPDIIVSDVMMPGKSGFEVTETLKNNESTSHIPIVLLTAKVDFESRIKGLKRGADVYLAKPFNREELLAHLENLLMLRHKLQARYQQFAFENPRAKYLDLEDQEKLFLDKIHQYVDAQLANADIKPGDVAKGIGMSRSALYAKLSAVTGMTINAYVQSIRLREAKKLLQTTSLPIAEVAYGVGFNDPNYFTRQFKKQFGVAPSKLRS